MTTIFSSLASAAMPISSCVVISTSGEYIITNNITDITVGDCINITINDVVLDGAGFTITGGGSGDGVYANNITSSLTNITIKNLIVRNWNNGIYYNGVSKGEITDNIVNSNNYGILLSFSSFNNLTNNIANYNSFVGIDLQSSSNYNILTNNVANYNILTDNIKNNTVNYNSYIGIYLHSYSSYNILVNNTANSNMIGIGLRYTGSNNLTDNIVNSNGINNVYGTGVWAIFLEYSHNNNILLNDANASNNDYSTAAGIYLRNSNDNDISNNRAHSNSGYTGNAYGIILIYSNNNNISNNIANSTGESYNRAIYIQGDGNIIYNNYFNNGNNTYGSNNTWNVRKTLGQNIIGGKFLGGNFWANPSGTGFSQICVDKNKDGICDSKYVLDSNNIDYLPLSNKSKINLSVKDMNITSISNIYIELENKRLKYVYI